MKKILSTFFLSTCVSAAFSLNVSDGRIDLRGQWLFSTSGTTHFADSVSLPGTMDTNHKGLPPESRDETTHLTRLYHYVGKAWYQREITIPKEWKKKNIFLHLERTKPATVWIDGDSIGWSNDISTPQHFSLGALKPGHHVLTVCVDNSSGVPQQLYANSHAYTEDTQTNWNGIIGSIFLSLSPDTYPKDKITSSLPCFRNFEIRGQHFFADGHVTFLRGKHDACVWPLAGHVPMDVKSWLWYLGRCRDYGINHVRFHSWCPPEAAFTAADSIGIYLQPELPFWGDFNEKDTVLMTFLHKEGENILRTYGRHPSFVMMALGNELWGSIPAMRRFVDDFRAIAPDKYFTFGSNYYLGYQGVKPGMDYFTTCRVGGEAWGSYNTHTRGSFAFADAADGGMINHFYPNTLMNFSGACLTARDTTGRPPVPVISHETAQFQTYPDYDEIKKYTGVLYPYNFEVFRDRLKKAGMLSQAKAFHEASGRWSAQLYKADVEMDLRTGNMAGFQLLDLQDYPGQGTALVGVLDAFMDSKGIITQKEWRQFCSPVVAMLGMHRYTYSAGDELSFKIQVANYGARSLRGKKAKVVLYDKNGRELQNVSHSIETDGEGLIDIASDCFDIPDTASTQRCNITVSIADGSDTTAVNTYPVWIYNNSEKQPENKGIRRAGRKAVAGNGVIETTVMSDETVKKLENGASVLWTPDSASFAGNTVGGLFQTDYWNWRMFKTISENNKKPVSPGTLGILTDGRHPVFNGFPTDDFTSWQWFTIIKNSRPLILDNLPQGYRPIIQVIDNIERNHKLGIAMEFSIGKGKLLIAMTDMKKIADKPEGVAYHNSILKYMQSDAFRPKVIFDFNDLRKAITARPNEIKIKELNNISPY